MKKKIEIAVSIVAIFVFLFLFFNPYKVKKRVGILLPVDDVSANFNARVGFLAAMRDLPKDVDFVDVDYTSNTLESAIKRASRMGIRYFVSNGYSSDLPKIDDILEKTHSVLIEVMVTNPELLRKAKYAFTLVPTDDIQASAIVSYLQNMNYKNVVVVKDTSDAAYVDNLVDNMMEDSKNVKWKSVYLNEIDDITKPPQAFVLVMSSVHAVKVVKNLKERFPKSAFIGSDWTFKSSLINQADVVNGMITVGFVDPIYINSSVNKKISSDDLFLTPQGVLSYDALKVAYILAKQNVNCEEVQKYLNSHSFFGMSGTFTFNGIHATTPVYFYKITPLGFKLAWEFGERS